MQVSSSPQITITKINRTEAETNYMYTYITKIQAKQLHNTTNNYSTKPETYVDLFLEFI